MSKAPKKDKAHVQHPALAKTPTGITGLDEITGGGLPLGRPTLVCGDAGCGKTLMSIEFIVRGATEFNEPGVFMAFEEKADELASNVASLGFDLDKLQATVPKLRKRANMTLTDYLYGLIMPLIALAQNV